MQTIDPRSQGGLREDSLRPCLPFSPAKKGGMESRERREDLSGKDGSRARARVIPFREMLPVLPVLPPRGMARVALSGRPALGSRVEPQRCDESAPRAALEGRSYRRIRRRFDSVG